MYTGGAARVIHSFAAPSLVAILGQLVAGLVVGFLVARYGLPGRPSARSALKIAGAAVVPATVLLHLLYLVVGSLPAALIGIAAMWIATTTVVMNETDVDLERSHTATASVCVPVLLLWLILAAGMAALRWP